MYKYEYDAVLVGAGLYNAALAAQMVDAGMKVLVLERRDSVGGNCADVKMDGILVHRHGAHIFHTSDVNVWNFACRFCEMMPYVNSPIALTRRKPENALGAYNLPFNMNTFSKIWSAVHEPDAMREIIEHEAMPFVKDSYANLEEKALSMVGPTIYNMFIKGYTEKQWGKQCTELPPDIITRIPLRFDFDNNYFNDIYQGIPKDGYTAWINSMLDGADVICGVDYLKSRKVWDAKAPLVYYSGRVDELLDYRLGDLPYRSLKFDTQRLDVQNYQGVAVVNFPLAEHRHTRSIEHKHFARWDAEAKALPYTYVTHEYPAAMGVGTEPYYPVRDQRGIDLFESYSGLVPPNIRLTGRLGKFLYADMDDTIAAAFETFKQHVEEIKQFDA